MFCIFNLARSSLSSFMTFPCLSSRKDDYYIQGFFFFSFNAELSVAFKCFRRHTWTFQIKMWQLLRNLYYVYISKSNYGSGGAWLLWSCIELQKGINPPNLLLYTHLERTAALILNEIAVLSAFLLWERSLDCLDNPWEGRKKQIFWSLLTDVA